jgi:hypothetical protein
MAGFSVQARDGSNGAPADPPTLASDTIPLGQRTLRVIRKRDDDADQPPVLVVEDA